MSIIAARAINKNFAEYISFLSVPTVDEWHAIRKDYAFNLNLLKVNDQI